MFSIQIGSPPPTGHSLLDYTALVVALLSLAGVILQAYLNWQDSRSKLAAERLHMTEERESLGKALHTEVAVRMYDLRWMAEFMRQAHKKMPQHHVEHSLDLLLDNVCDAKIDKCLRDLESFLERAWPLLPDVLPDQMQPLANSLKAIATSVETVHRLRDCVEKCSKDVKHKRFISAGDPCNKEWSEFKSDVLQLGGGLLVICDNLGAKYRALGHDVLDADPIDLELSYLQYQGT
jgi:hypothetical protein